VFLLFPHNENNNDDDEVKDDKNYNKNNVLDPLRKKLNAQ
jgi:hypothetical protein